MAWNIHFNGQVFGPVSDSDADEIKNSVLKAMQNGDAAVFGSVVGDTKLEAIWTIGTPISFEYLAED